MKKFIFLVLFSSLCSMALAQSNDYEKKNTNQFLVTAATMATASTATWSVVNDEFRFINTYNKTPQLKQLIKKSSKASRILVPLAVLTTGLTVYSLAMDSDPGELLRSKARFTQSNRSHKKEATESSMDYSPSPRHSSVPKQGLRQ